ncbi:MAG TPA: ABC transporter ATP-binding protein [Candidatus Omnitrophota bacterium]|nr:ABC transporter ATP-binding protein [Candidatus Omnitrophota bacterium]
MNKEPLVEVINLSRYYKDGNVLALDRVNLKVSGGEFLTIKGSSGSGKSTLLHIIGGLDLATSGEIYFQGQPAGNVYRQQGFRLNHLGFVFQAFYLWPALNVLENVLLPLMESSLSRQLKLQKAQSAVDLVGMSDKLNTPVNHLSIGQRQRVAIARALVMDPKLILADEPTGNLDSKNTENILTLFRDLKKHKNVTIVMVTHEEKALTFCDRWIQLSDGRIQ